MPTNRSRGPKCRLQTSQRSGRAEDTTETRVLWITLGDLQEEVVSSFHFERVLQRSAAQTERDLKSEQDSQN